MPFGDREGQEGHRAPYGTNRDTGGAAGAQRLGATSGRAARGGGMGCTSTGRRGRWCCRSGDSTASDPPSTVDKRFTDDPEMAADELFQGRVACGNDRFEVIWFSSVHPRVGTRSTGRCHSGGAPYEGGACARGDVANGPPT